MRKMLIEFFDCKIIAESYPTSFTDVNHVVSRVLFNDASFALDFDAFLPTDVVSDSSALGRALYKTASERYSAFLRTVPYFESLWRIYSSSESFEYSKICDCKLF